MQVFVVSFSIPVAGMYVYRAVKQVGEENAYIIGWLLRKWSLEKLKFRSWWSSLEVSGG